MMITKPDPGNIRRIWCLVLLAGWVAGTCLSAEETNALSPSTPPPYTPEEFFEGGTNYYDNWIELAAGGFFPDGNKAQFQQRQQSPGGAFGGIQDFHYQRDLGKDTTFTMDGRAIFDNHDYALRLDVVRPETGFVRFSYNQYRTWYNGDGGYFPPTDTFYSLSDDTLTLDRGSLLFEAGLTLENVPNITFRYEHQFRDGQKGSTSWGLAQPVLNLTRGLNPSFYDIDETRDIFQLDVDHTIKATDLGLGVRYEHGELDNARNMTQSLNVPLDKVTDREGTTYDFLNVHAFTESRIKKNVLLSSAFAFNHVDNDFSGSRVYGTVFDAGYTPAPQNGRGYTGLDGESRRQEYLFNLNLMATPWRTFSIVPSVRVQKEDWDAESAGFETVAANPPTAFTSMSDRDALDVRERLDLRLTAVTNWVFYGRGEWTQGDGKLNEQGGVGPTPPVLRETEDKRFFQKYVAGINWYPMRRLSLDAQYYYKLHNYDYDHPVDDTDNALGNRYPAYLVTQRFQTHDFNARLTLRPRRNLSLVTRYDFQLSTVNSEPDPASGIGSVEASDMTSHIIAQNISWSPWKRLFTQVAFSYVLSETTTPAADLTPAVLDSENNYWTLFFTSGFVLTDKTDLNAGFYYYNADNYADNSPYVSYGVGGEEYGVTCGATHKFTENIRLNLRYGFSSYRDETSGGNLDYTSHLVYSSLQYRF